MYLRIALLVITALALGGCVTAVRGPVPYGDGVYLVLVSKSHGKALRPGYGRIVAAERANAYCQAQGKIMIPLDQPLTPVEDVGGSVAGRGGKGTEIKGPGRVTRGRRSKSEVSLLFSCEAEK